MSGGGGAEKRRRGLAETPGGAGGALADELERLKEEHTALQEELATCMAQKEAFAQQLEAETAAHADFRSTAIPANTEEEVVEAARKLGEFAGAHGIGAFATRGAKRYDVPDMLDFKLSGWLTEFKAAGVGNVMLAEFMDGAIAAASPGDVSTEERHRRQKCLSLAVANILQACNARWKWAFGFLHQFVLKTITMSATAVNMCAKSTPGAPTDHGLRTWMRRHVEDLKSVGIVLREDSELLIEYDNVGIYVQRTSRATVSKAYHRPVVTSMEAFHLLDGRPGSTLLQKMEEHSPLNWRKPQDALEAGFAGVRTDKVDGAAYSEREMLDAESRLAAADAFLTALRETFAAGGSFRKRDSGTWEDPLMEDTLAEQMAGGQVQTKTCPDCKTQWGMRKIVCDNCKFRPLTSAADVVAAVTPTKFAALRQRLVRFFTKTRRWRRNEETGTVELLPQEARPPPTEELVGEVPVTLTAIMRDLLLCEMVNPNTEVNVAHVLTQAGRLGKLMGFVSEESAALAGRVRYWFYIGSNGGAAPLDLVDPEDPAPGAPKKSIDQKRFERFFFRMDIGHEDAVLLRLVAGMAWAMGGKHLAECHGFASEGGKKLLQKCLDLHKGYDWVMRVLQPAMLRTFLREYVHHAPGEKTVDGFFDFLKAFPNDNTFTSHAKFWVLDVIPAYASLHNGIRNNDYTAYAAGRKALLPLLYARNNRNYGPLILRDLSIIDFRCVARAHMRACEC
jgi:hypothetical protein